MKRLSAAVLALALCAPLTLGACSGATQTATQDATKTEDQAATQDATQDTKTQVSDTTAAADESVAAEASSAGETGSAAEADSAGETSKKTSSSKSTNIDDLASWGIKIAVPDGATGVLRGNEYYVYTTKKSFPYVLVCVYNMDKTGEDFLKEFTDYMKKQHKDLKVTSEPKAAKIGDKSGVKTVYTYEIEGHPARDTRFVVPANKRVYMFATKEIDDLKLSVVAVSLKKKKDAEIYQASK